MRRGGFGFGFWFGSGGRLTRGGLRRAAGGGGFAAFRRNVIFDDVRGQGGLLRCDLRGGRGRGGSGKAGYLTGGVLPQTYHVAHEIRPADRRRHDRQRNAGGHGRQTEAIGLFVLLLCHALGVAHAFQRAQDLLALAAGAQRRAHGPPGRRGARTASLMAVSRLRRGICGAMRYIVSGALTPRMSRALRSTCPMPRSRARRATVRGVSSGSST